VVKGLKDKGNKKSIFPKIALSDGKAKKANFFPIKFCCFQIPKTLD